jgi:hypothetical protein
MKRISLLAAVAAALCAIVSGCEDPVSRALAGEVAFIELRESVDSSGAKKGSLDYEIRNTGKSKIEGTSFSFSFSTDKRKYHFTVVDENAVESGKLVYGQAAVAYEAADESGKLASAVVDSAQFK